MPSITIEIPINEIILSNGEHDGYETISYEYDYDWEDRAEIILDFVVSDYKLDREIIEQFINDFDLWDILDEQYEEYVDEALRDKFYHEAVKQYNNGDYY